jgi:putative transposase
MSRPLRIQYPDAWYHVMNRGQNHCAIFQNDDQRHLFLELLADIYNRYGVETHAYCLMDNHYHLLLHTQHANLSRAMRHLDGVYTQKFNQEMKRDGALFRGRYKAILIEAENYMLQLSRYIHLNPVSARICTNASDYKWSSYPAYIKLVNKPMWLSYDECLSRCSENSSIEDYRKYVEGNNLAEFIEILPRAQWLSVLGSEEWIEKLKHQYKINDEIPASKELSARKLSENIEDIAQRVANYYGLEVTDLKKRGNRYNGNKARNFFIYMAVAYYGYENKKIAIFLENVSISAVRQIRIYIKKKLGESNSFSSELEKLKEACGLAGDLPISNLTT